MGTFVLVHGAWHAGAALDDVATIIRSSGHIVHAPTLKGNRANDSKRVGLHEAIESVIDHLINNDLHDVILVGHSYGGIVITGVADREPRRLRRLVYWSAFVPNDGESLLSMIPPEHAAVMEGLAATRDDGAVMIPFPVWREAFMNDVDFATAERAYAGLNAHPFQTFRDEISLRTNPALLQIGKSYINATEDFSLPHVVPFHPTFSKKLGLFRLIQVPGGHEICFSNPQILARAILDAGRD